MEQLKSELTLALGETISRLEMISEHPPTRLYALYDRDGRPMPVVAKYFRHQGRAAMEARKLALLGQAGLIAVPAVYGLVMSQQPPVHEMLLLARLNGVTAEAPARDAQRWQQFCEQVVEGVLAWHRLDSHGLVGTVDSTQQNSWPAWYAQRVEVLWATLSYLRPPAFTLEDRQILFRCRARLAYLFRGFDDPCVMVHGNIQLQSMLKDSRSDQLIAMTQPGTILWAPREYDLIHLDTSPAETALLHNYLQRAPVSEGFVWRRWVYQLWDCIEHLVQTGTFDRPRFDHARAQLLPWLG
ncbi:fructosamine kinase family protein [Pantoea agglomerans]|uniref:fructosamine kinase family protein n=1 Tax=Enterobacter agglomerans TaxID=549 RepID=UPI002A6A885C|nr:fructosamine kinase family protein [Pantoea agglomerans]MDY0899864.1 fructosamine kinase family protein [Pantoea agglomerans]